MDAVKEQTEQHILRLVREHNSSAMRLLYDRYIGYMAAVCGRYVAEENDRKDILQDSFIKIMTSIGSFQHRGEGSLKAWMLRITVNESLRFIKKHTAERLIDCGDSLPDVADEPDVEGIPDDEINSMILKLPPGYRAVFNLYVFEEKSHREIAEALGISENTSASQYLRAKQSLAKMIREYKTNRLNE